MYKEGRRLLEFCDEKELQALGFIRQTKGKSLMAPVDISKIDFVLVREKYRKYVKNVKVIPWNFSTSWWL